MNKIIIIAVIIFMYGNTNAQWSGTNPLRTNSDVGIGSNIPLGQLHILQANNPSQYILGAPIPLPNLVLSGQCSNLNEPVEGTFLHPSANTDFSINANCYNDNLLINQIDINTGTNFNILSLNQNYVTVNTNNFNVKDVLYVNPNYMELNKELRVNAISKFNNDMTLTGSLTVIGVNPNTNGINQIKLRSDGYIRAREIKVDYDYIPDYVFKEGYKLMPLVELEKYIEKEKHLPNIKGENEFSHQEGYSLGEMNLKLLEKVEELTLYMIQMKKQNDDLQAQINKLKTK